MRTAMLNRLNGLLGGVLHCESWTLSQASYFGQVNGVDFELAIGSGDECIDEADELEPGLPYQPTASQSTAAKTGKSSKSRPDYAGLSEIRAARFDSYWRTLSRPGQRVGAALG